MFPAAGGYNGPMFTDHVRIYVKGGDGGNGIVAFRREKFVPLGGPAGGSGGRGGHVIFYVDEGMNTLSRFRQQVHFRAERGGHGGGANKTGANGDDLRIAVPPGTLIYEADDGPLLADLTLDEQEAVIAHGGRGGRGNTAFKSPRNKAPRMAEKGEVGEEHWLELELKLVADVGIIGVPNAGKSTLLSVVSAAKPKIADYPFTTITPNLGVAEVNHRTFVLADIPGLMEGAHEGIGLGIEFLRHIERTRILIHLLNGDSPDPLGDFEAINQELVLFNPALVDRQQIVVFNKMDLPHARDRWPEIEETIQRYDLPVMSISAVTRQDVDQLLYRVQAMLDALPPEEAPYEHELPEITPDEDESAFTVEQLDDETWKVAGIAIERTAQMTNWDYYEAGARFQRILHAMVIVEALREAGVEDGDTVQIGEAELVWGYDNAFEE